MRLGRVEASDRGVIGIGQNDKKNVHPMQFVPKECRRRMDGEDERVLRETKREKLVFCTQTFL